MSLRQGGVLGCKSLWTWAVFTIVLTFQSHAQAGNRPTVGDEDPFPLHCVDFSGQWRSDSGSRYNIGQRDCNYLKFAMTFGTEQVSLTIVPDNHNRAMPGHSGMVRHRWNSFQRATVLETHSVYHERGSRVTEVVMYEMATPNLLLETTYRTIECYGSSGQVRHETEQEVFRRISAGKGYNAPKRRIKSDFR